MVDLWWVVLALVFDNVDLSAAAEHGRLVVNSPTATTIATAEHRTALLTSMAHYIPPSDSSIKVGLHYQFTWIS